MSRLPLLKPHERDENLLVDVTFRSDTGMRRAVGVLLREEGGMRRIGFNARNDEVIDYLDIAEDSIVKIRIVEKDAVKVLG